MNYQLQQALAQILTKSINAVEAGTSLLQTQLPDVIQQLLLWKLVESALSLVGGIAGVLTVILFLRWAFKRPVKDQDTCRYKTTIVYNGCGEIHYGAIAVIIGTLVASGISISLIHDGFHWLQIWLAPKVYLIEYAAHLAK